MTAVAELQPQGEFRITGTHQLWSVSPPRIEPACPDLSAHIIELPQPETILASPPLHVLVFLLSGSARVKWEHEGQLREQQLAPGHITLVPASSANRFEIQGYTRTLHWRLWPAMLHAVAEQELDCGRDSIELPPLFAINDEHLWRYGQDLVTEMAEPGSWSHIYVETLIKGLVVQLLRRHSSLATRKSHHKGLSPRKLRLAIDYIKDNLSEEVDLNSLADEVGLSPYHFAKSFKQATGLPPHRFILRERVDRSMRQLEDPRYSIVEVALAVGFSSQSHFTNIFRRMVGVTPKVYREAHVNPKGTQRMQAP